MDLPCGQMVVLLHGAQASQVSPVTPTMVSQLFLLT